MVDEKDLKDVVDEETTETNSPESEEIQSGIVAGLTDADLTSQVKDCFLDYAMSVIVSRAIPDVRDGCKPVHRRVIFGMHEGGMLPNVPHKKCARIVGDVMGKYHPHGDAAIYSTLARMAQNFSMRYTLVDGHGNFGSIDGDEPAAMRYTEARMSKLALEMVRDIKCNVVDFVDNYDGTEREPSVLPSRIPNLLINGSSGIAVGMATNIPTHNLGETIDAIVAYAHNPEITVDEIMENYLHGPDFPSGGIILGKEGIKDYFETGSGSIMIRSRTEIKINEKTGKKQIFVSEIPYQVNKASLVKSIGDLAREKTIDGITGIRDESNKNGIRIVIDIRHDCVPEVILNKLFKLTQLQTSYGVTMLCLVDAAPAVLPIKSVLGNYLTFQMDVIKRRTNFLLKQDSDRMHIVIGLLKAIEFIDEIVDLIKAAKTPEEASENLKSKFGFSDEQTNAILAMTLRRLTGLEEGKLEEEKATLESNIAKYNFILESDEHIKDVVVSELLDIKEKFNDERKTDITNEALEIDDEDLIPEEDIIIVLTTNNYVKRCTIDTFRTQNRGGRGVKGMTTNEDDEIALLSYTKTHTDVLFFSNFGKVYRIRGYNIPEGSRISKGLPIQNVLDLEKGERIMAIISLDEYNPDNFIFFITKNGLVKRTKLSEFESIRRNGKIAIELRDGDQLLDVKLTNGSAFISLVSTNGKMVKFKESDVRPMGRTATGVIGMNVDGGNVISATTSLEGNYILVITQLGFGKMSPIDEYKESHRGTKGVSAMNATEKTGRVVAMRAVNGVEDLMIVTSQGIILRIPLGQVKISHRKTQGVHVIRLEGKQKVSSITVVAHDDEAEFDEIDAENQNLVVSDADIEDSEVVEEVSEVVKEAAEDTKE